MISPNRENTRIETESRELKGLTHQRARRRGASSVEFALVAIPLFAVLFASLEFGRGMMVVQSIEEAARNGCRIAVLKGMTPTDVQNAVDEVMNAVGVASHSTNVQPTTLSTMPQWDPVTVIVTVNHSDVSLLPLPNFLAGKSYTASCTLPREGTPN